MNRAEADNAPVFAQMSALTKVRSETPGDEVVGPSPLHLPVGADGRHGEGGDGSDYC